MQEPTFRYIGDTSLQVGFEPMIRVETNRKVIGLMAALQAAAVPGIVEYVPSYCTLTIYYRPECIAYAALVERCRACIAQADAMPAAVSGPQALVDVPVLYGGELGPDLDAVAQVQSVDAQEIIRIHTQYPSYAYMLGFSPGHASTARLEEPFRIQRRPTPVLRIPARSLVVIGNQSDLIPFPQPTGWHVIGSTPLLMTDFRKPAPFLFAAGQWLQFRSIVQKEYDEIRRLSDLGRYDPARGC